MNEIRKKVRLADYSTFRIGGLAEEFVEVFNEKELLEVLSYAGEKKIKLFFLGGGSNVVFSESGFSGLVVKLSFKKQETLPSDYFWAGNGLSDLVALYKKQGFSGLEWAAGIPGSLGGAIRGNAGAFGGSIGEIVQKVRAINVLDNEGMLVKEFSQEDCLFDYRSSFFKENPDWVVVSASLKKEKGDQAQIGKRIEEILEKRKNSQPTGWFGSAGSFFKNPVVKNLAIREKFEKDTGKKLKDEKVPAGWLIQDVNLLGKKVGGMEISKEHGNFIINTGNGTFEELVILVGIIKQKIREVFEIELKEEVQIINE